MRRIAIWIAVVLLASVTWAAPPEQQITDYSGFVLDIRRDLELLADNVFGDGQRPEAWTNNVDYINSSNYLLDLWFDTEQLAAQIFGEIRPANWVGVPTAFNPAIIARNIRYDLETAADQFFGQGNRPPQWRGGTPLTRCARELQNLVQVLTDEYDYNFQTPTTAVNYCATITAEAEEQVLRLALLTPEFESQVPGLTLAVRGDLERLADEEYGLNTRPQQWRANKNIDSPTLASDILLDLDTLATTQLGAGTRPPNWIGVLPNAPALAYRNLRHDLELLADALGYSTRPRGWQGGDALIVCEPVTQDLVILLQQAYGLAIDTIPADTSYCGAVALAANQLAENPPAPAGGEGGGEEDRFLAESNYAFTYLDLAATQYMGVMPPGIKFKAWYRNFGDSTMMFVSGQDFAVYLDLRWTTLAPELFERLPTLEGVKPLTFCDASWCNGPGPTPTPTGAGALELLLQAGTPIATPNIGEVQAEKKQVSWNYIRVTYLLDNATTRTAQVALEICSDTAQANCEPVLQVFDNALGAPKPVLSQFNGLNVYEFPYGYSSNLLIEGASLFSPDVWISDPTIR